MNPAKILCLFDYNSFTGFAQVSKNLIANWKKTFGNSVKFNIIAINYFGEDYAEDENVKVISAKLKDIAKDDFGRHVFLATILKEDYDAVFILQDLGVIVPIIKHLEEIKQKRKAENRKSFKSFFYFPVDFELNSMLITKLDFFDELYTYTHWGKEMATKWNEKLQKKIKVVPHGNNSKDFYYHSDWLKIGRFRREYFGEKNAQKFIIGNINRNQSRKDIPNTILGFYEYREKYNTDSFLYLHMNPTDPMGWNLRAIFNQTGLVEGKDYMFPPEEDYNKGSDIAKMNEIYNSIDLFLTTTTGEGWGLTITEAMATRRPIVAPIHTAITEITNDGNFVWGLKKLRPIVAMVDNVIRYQTDIEEIADRINEVFEEIKESEDAQDTMPIDRKLDSAWTWVRKLDWKNIAQKFSDDFKKHLKIESP